MTPTPLTLALPVANLTVQHFGCFKSKRVLFILFIVVVVVVLTLIKGVGVLKWACSVKFLVDSCL